MRKRSAREGFAGIALCCLAAVGTALVSQYRFGMQPCPWCVLQRVILLAAFLLCLLGILLRPGARTKAIAALLVGLGISGAAAALWQHFWAAASASCNLTLADKIVAALKLNSALPDVFEARASCADAAVSLLGVPYDFWSLALFALMAMAAFALSRRESR